MLLVLHRLSVDSKVLQGCRKRRELFRHDSTNSLSLSLSPSPPFFILLPQNPIPHIHDTSFSFLSFQNKRVTITTEARWRATGCVCLSSGFRRRWREDSDFLTVGVGVLFGHLLLFSHIRARLFAIVAIREDTQCAVWDSNNKQDTITMDQGGPQLLAAAEMEWTMNWSQLY